MVQMNSIDQVAEVVRVNDRDRYLSALFAPAAARRHLLALYAFNAEIARVRESVNEPGIGEIRLQFWHDALHADGAGHPVGQALVETIATYSLPLDAFDKLIEARRFDLYDDPMPSLNDLEGYAGETSSSLIQLGAMILVSGRDPGTAEIAGHGGVAYALTGLMQALPIHASRGQIFLPADLLAAHGVDRSDILAGRTSPALLAALAELRSVARGHLDAARKLAADLKAELFPAVLPLALIDPRLQVMERSRHNPLAATVDISQMRRQWILWRAAKQSSF
jgi:phytoene synthase